MTSGQIYFILFLISSSFGAGWEVEKWHSGMLNAKHDEAQQEIIIQAEKKVIITQNTQTAVSSEVSKLYEEGLRSIDRKYSSELDSLYKSPITTTDSVSKLPATTGRHHVGSGATRLPKRNKHDPNVERCFSVGKEG